jgi:hypothetical protein
MDVRVYEVFLQFNQGLDQALTSLEILEKLALESPSCIAKIRVNLSELRSYANKHFASKIAQKEQEEENNLYRLRRNREKAEGDPNEIYFDVKAHEKSRRERGLAPVPWSCLGPKPMTIASWPRKTPRPPRSRHNPNSLGP